MSVQHRWIYHITSKDRWDEAGRAGVYRGDTLETEGFIHASTQNQVLGTAALYFRGVRGLVLLEIDTQKLTAEVRYEAAPSGEQFPHIYGPLNLDAVNRVMTFESDQQGEFHWPVG